MGEFKNENQAIIDAIRELYCVETIDVQGHAFLVHPSGVALENVQATIDDRIDRRGIAPRRCVGTMKVDTLAAFNDAVARFRLPATTVYVHDGQAPKIVAVINEATDATTPGWRDHRIEYSPAISEEWQAWTNAAGKQMSQADFAAFIEDRCLDILDGSKVGPQTKDILERLAVTPATPAAVQALAKGLAIHVDSVVQDVRSLDSGEVQFSYSEQHTGAEGKPLNVARAFVIAIPVFLGGDAYSHVVRLRYKVAQNRITWSFAIVGSDKAKRDAVLGMIETMKSALPDMLIMEGVA